MSVDFFSRPKDFDCKYCPNEFRSAIMRAHSTWHSLALSVAFSTSISFFLRGSSSIEIWWVSGAEVTWLYEFRI